MTTVITKIVMLYLTVYNCATGAVLYESTRRMPDFSLSGDRIEDCRQVGVSQAETLTVRFRQAYPNASTNVVCRWERGQPSQRARIKKGPSANHELTVSAVARGALGGLLSDAVGGAGGVAIVTGIAAAVMKATNK